ncbi:MAG: type 4a pilus biogenesis protein PilO [Burkholderiaceae bacterium]
MIKLDMAAIREEFEGLQGRHPGLWPLTPRVLLMIGMVIGICLLAYLLYWRGLQEEHQTAVSRERSLRSEFEEKMTKAVNLPVLRQQKNQVAQYVSILEKQLPSKAEMDALLSDINQAGVGRGLQFDLFKPSQVVVRDYYAELPINIRLVGGYHELGHFTSDVANLPRIVTLNDIALKLDDKTGQISMEAIANTFRYLDAEEIAEQRKAKAAAARKGGRG